MAEHGYGKGALNVMDRNNGRGTEAVTLSLAALGLLTLLSGCLSDNELTRLEARQYPDRRGTVAAAAVGAMQVLGYPVAAAREDVGELTILSGVGPLYYTFQVVLVEQDQQTTVQPRLFYNPSYRNPALNPMHSVGPREHPSLYRDFFKELERRLEELGRGS